MTIEIVRLADRPDLLDTIAQWHWAEWGRRIGATPAQIAAHLEPHLQPQPVPQAFILLESGHPAGTATLDHADLDSRPDLTPWLANVYVPPTHRGRGHAKRLVRHVEAAARTAGITPLYLHTEDAQSLYASLGWTPIGPETHNGHTVTVMQRVLF